MYPLPPVNVLLPLVYPTFKISTLTIQYLVALDLLEHENDWAEFLETLLTGDGIGENEGVALGYRQPLHGRELMRPGRVRDLQRANVLLIAADYLCTYQCLGSTRILISIPYRYQFRYFTQISFRYYLSYRQNGGF